MRLLLHLQILSNNKSLPINYQYPVTAWIYKTLHHSNSHFAEWLHQHGYSYVNKKFKLFTFSQLKFEKAKVESDRIISQNDNCKITLSFLLPETFNHFIYGCFANQEFSIGDKISRIDFAIKNLEILQKPKFLKTMNFKLLTPIVVSKPEQRNNKLIAQYLKPDDKEYKFFLFQNLIQKHKAANNVIFDIDEIEFQPNSEAKSRLVTIKAGTSSETKIKGYIYSFTFSAPEEIMHTAYYAGFGESNSLGFGYVDYGN
ncbi:MAG: CRISPR-associated endoribonuclease Cas6 [Bacteroidia bacterium]